VEDRVGARLVHTLDAEYLAITKLQADALITIDEAMAAKANGLVPMAAVADLVAG